MFARIRTFVCLLAALAAAGCLQRSPPEPILIGLAVPLSGPDRLTGERIRQGALLAVEDINQEGKRIAGRIVKLLDADTHGDPELVQPQAVRFITVNRVTAFVGGADPGQAERMARAAQPYQVPVVATCGLAPSAGVDNLFLLEVSPTYRAKILARYVAEAMKALEGVVVLADGRQEPSIALASAFVRELKDRGIRASFKSYHDDTQFADLAGEVVKAQPAVLLLAGVSPALIRKLRASWDGDRQPMLLFGGGEGQAAALQADREAADGVYLATAYLASCNTEANQKFVQRYQERFDQEEPGALAALAYDGSRLLFETMGAVRTLLPGRVREELTRVGKFEGLTGTISFSKEHGTRRPMFLVRLEQGKPQLVQRYE
jgi:branched-chain amino acid transport system substrate-binding protein